MVDQAGGGQGKGRLLSRDDVYGSAHQRGPDDVSPVKRSIQIRRLKPLESRGEPNVRLVGILGLQSADAADSGGNVVCASAEGQLSRQGGPVQDPAGQPRQ